MVRLAPAALKQSWQAHMNASRCFLAAGTCSKHIFSMMSCGARQVRAAYRSGSMTDTCVKAAEAAWLPAGEPVEHHKPTYQLGNLHIFAGLALSTNSL